MKPASYNKLIKRHQITDATVLAFTETTHIPEQYIQKGDVLDGLVVGEDESHQLPVIDMSRLLDPEFSELEIKKLGAACRNWGFFQLTNHGVDETVIQEIKENTVQFFSLPLDRKKTVAVREKGLEGFGHHFSTASGKLDWAQSLLLRTLPVEARNMEMWPVDPSMFKHALDKYSVEIMNLTLQLLPFMAADLGVEKETLQGAFTRQWQTVALHYYPPCQQPEKVFGITPHTDGLGLTLLLQLDDTPGLQIKKDGRWFPVQPLPGAFVINIADILEVLTNGAYKSVEHRVLPDRERGRITVAIAQAAAVVGLVAPLPGLLKGGEARYKSIEIEQYMKDLYRTLADGIPLLEILRI